MTKTNNKINSVEEFKKLKWKIFWTLKLKEIGFAISSFLFFFITSPIVGKFFVNLLGIPCAIVERACEQKDYYFFGIVSELVIGLSIFLWCFINLEIAHDKAEEEMANREDIS